MLLMVACGPEEDIDRFDSNPHPSGFAPKVYRNVFELTYEQTQFTFNIENEGSWKLETNADWLTPDKTQGDDNGQVTVKCAGNTTKERREGKIIITSTANSKKSQVIVRQTGLPLDTAHLVSHCGFIGNHIKGEKSYIEMTFDQPVRVEEWESDVCCVDYNTLQYSDDHCTARFDFPAAGYGFKVDCCVTVINDDNVRTKFHLTFEFYDKHYSVEGEIRGAKVSPDEQSLWIATSDPSKLIEMSLIDGSILHEINMPFAPGAISFNPYNGQLYVMPVNYINGLDFSNSFCIVDPQKGVITNTITIEPPPLDDSQDPIIYPYSVEFTRDGFGILMLRSNVTTGLVWRYVDSANGNKITVSEYSGSSYEFEHVYQGCNQQSLYANTYPQLFHELYQITRQHRAPQLHELKTDFNNTAYYAGGNMMSMVFHRYCNRVFIATAPACQCVVDLDKMSYSEVTDAEARGTKAAWDYSDHSRNLVYYVGGQWKFLLLDMDKANCIYHADCVWNGDDICSIDHLEKTDQILITHLLEGVYLISAVERRMKE